MNLPQNYNELTPQQRRLVRQQYIRLQKWRCCHCKEPLYHPPAQAIQDLFVNEVQFPAGFFRWPVHLHHSRKTNMTIGAVHARCNAVLWQYHGE